MKLNFLNAAATIFTSLLLITSCSSDDDSSNSGVTDAGSGSTNECPSTPTDQVAQGNFSGTDFTSSGGTYLDRSFGEQTDFFCRIYVKSPISIDDCSFPEFDGTQDSILFSIASLEAQTINVSEEFTIGDNGELPPTLSFNRIGTEFTEAELSCGTIIIDGLNDVDQLTGSVIATGVDGSSIDGNFVLDFCNPSF